MLHDLPPPTLVQDARGLERMLADAARHAEIAVDTEADSFFSYREKVCLIQVSFEERDYLVDPLAGFDLSPLGALTADPRRVKVFHDAEYDVLLLKRSLGFTFKNLFDTRVAAATLGSKTPGLATVLQQRFGIELDKSMQRSNWGERPLSERQIRYARLDTRFLITLMREQRPELEQRDRLCIVEGECRRLEGLEPPANDFDPEEWVRLKGARTLQPAERRALRELFVLRDRLAEASDQPPFRIMNNETLIELARRSPHVAQELSEVTGFTWKQVRRLGESVLETIARARELPPIRDFPELESRDGTGELDELQLELHERLKSLRKTWADQLDTDPAYVINRHVLLRLAKEQPRDWDALERLPGLDDWQLDDFGAELLDAIARFRDDVQTGKFKPKRRRWRG